MDETNAEIFQAIAAHDSVRIVADIPTNRINLDEPLTSATELLSPFVTQWDTKHETRLLVVDVYPRHTYSVIDIDNQQYDYTVAHSQPFAIAVYILRLSMKGKWTFFRRAVEDQRIAREIAELHRCNGWNPLPFLADHIHGPVYLSPRTT